MFPNNPVPVVDVCGKRIVDYLIESLARFNRKATQVIVRGIGGNISKAASVAQILADRFGCHILSASLESVTLSQTKAPCLQTTLSFEPSQRQKEEDYRVTKGFVKFPVYHLLLDMLLHRHSPLLLSTRAGGPLVTIEKTTWSFKCMPAVDSGRTWDMTPNLVSAYYRSGLLLSPYWRKVGQELSQYDDVIFGIDTNILQDAVLSEQLLTSLFMIDPRGYVHTPNWVLVVIPNAVIHELEQAANSRDDHGYLLHGGRMGFRALQEILELNSSADLSGISLIVVGDADPALDTRVELHALRQDFARRARDKSAIPGDKISSDAEQSETTQRREDIRAMSRLTTSGDMIVRAQFKQFLRQIDFHKGVFFITADKSNAALARAEGLHSIYYSQPHQQEAEHELEPPSIQCNSTLGPIVIGVPIGRLLYELAVEFGKVQVAWNGGRIEFASDRMGKSLDHWIGRELMFDADVLRKPLDLYANSGQFPLRQVNQICEEIHEQLTGGEAL